MYQINNKAAILGHMVIYFIISCIQLSKSLLDKRPAINTTGCPYFPQKYSTFNYYFLTLSKRGTRFVYVREKGAPRKLIIHNILEHQSEHDRKKVPFG